MVRRVLLGVATLFTVAGLSMPAEGQTFANVRLNEIFVDSPGADDVNEFFELRDITNSSVSLTGLWFVVIEGDGAAAGTVDVALNLSGFTTNSGNGLFLWRASTSVPSGGLTGTNINTVDFSPDIENGTNTYLLVSNFTGTVGTDLDTNNDGILDSTPWSSVIDAIAYTDGGAGDLMYAASLGFVNFTGLSFTPDTVFRLRDDPTFWVAADVTASVDGFNPYPYDPTEFANITGGALTLANYDIQQTTPGGINPAVIPEPTTLLLGGIGMAGVVYARRRQLKKRTA